MRHLKKKLESIFENENTVRSLVAVTIMMVFLLSIVVSTISHPFCTIFFIIFSIIFGFMQFDATFDLLELKFHQKKLIKARNFIKTHFSKDTFVEIELHPNNHFFMKNESNNLCTYSTFWAKLDKDWLGHPDGILNIYISYDNGKTKTLFERIGTLENATVFLESYKIKDKN